MNKILPLQQTSVIVPVKNEAHSIGIIGTKMKECLFSNNLASLFILLLVFLPVVVRFKYSIKYVKVTDSTSGFRAVTRPV